jgi:hypothetical protein
MRKLLLLLGAGIVLVLGSTGSGAFAAPKETCSSGMSGSHGSVAVVGPCFVGADVTINGNLTLADGSIFAGFGTVTITGNVSVGKGAQLFLGWDADEGELGPDSVGGNIVANQPLSLYIGNVTVHGNLVSNGGGTAARFYNFPIKDNRVDGNLVIHGWTGGWWGVIANSVGGNVDVANNRSVVQPAGECEGTFPRGCDAAPGADTDAAEVQSRGIPGVFLNPQHISGNLICHGNSPSAQVNALDAGAANVVDRNKIGECAGL